jgi:phosphopantothenoylcysteine decarboxylase/phosphopantothenate--cysteine ligase
LLTSTVMAARCPVVVVPAANAAMWEKPAVQRNVRQLREDGYDVVQPANGIEIDDYAPDFGSMGDYRPAVIAAISKAIAARSTDPEGSHTVTTVEADVSSASSPGT